MPAKTEFSENPSELKSSFWERLKICWHFLTKKNYIYFGMRKDGIYEGEDEITFYSKPNTFSCYIYTAPQKGIPFDTGKLFLNSAKEYLEKLIEDYEDQFGEKDDIDLEKIYNGEISE